MAIIFGLCTLDDIPGGFVRRVSSGVKSFSINSIFIIAISVLVSTSGVSSKEYPDGVNTARFIEIQQLLFNDRFVEADSLSRLVIWEKPDDPAGYLFRAAVLIGEMVDREENLYGNTFHQLLDKVDVTASQILDTASMSTAAWMHLFKGHAKVYQSLWESRFGAFTNSVSLGMSARSEYERGLDCDSTLYDLYFGLGAYHYWKSAKAGLLRWLGFFKNEKDKGITELYLAVDSSLISKESARNSLIWIWLDKKEYDSVITICREMLEKYPEGKVLLWPMGEAFLKKHRYREALETYLILRERLEIMPGNYKNLIECDYHLYRCYDKLKMKKEGKKVAVRLSQYYKNIPGKVRNSKRTEISYLRRIARL